MSNFYALVGTFLFCVQLVNCQTLADQQKQLNKIAEDVRKLQLNLDQEQKNLQEALLTVSTLTRQMMLQQLFVEERIRSDGSSGVKSVRTRTSGSMTYHSESHTGRSTCSIHDHTNYISTIGMGEFIGVLNGVEFRTRHNDYKLVMPHSSVHGASDKGFHAVENIPFPPVPPQVLAKKTLTEQINEMKEWFKAWRDSNHAVRDYRKFFRPVLCYLEGAWMADAKKFDESFPSDRHNLDASSWFDLQEKIRFTSNTGRKSILENFAYLPTTIADTITKGNLTMPILAQWNYRILCHPVKKDLPLNMIRPVDDLHMRMGNARKWSEVYAHRGTRFQININNASYWREIAVRDTVLNDIMNEIPGKDNYAGNLVDNAFGFDALKVNEVNTTLNTAYYHNWYKVDRRDAMGITVIRRGFHDENVYMAMTSSPKVAPSKVNDCVTVVNPITNKREPKCTVYTQRYSYAIPLELIYLTPLSNWNPFNLIYKGDDGKSALWRSVNENGRNGRMTNTTAYNGTNSNFFYRTPAAFFDGSEVGKDSADTVKGAAGVLDNNGVVRTLTASGIRILLPNIPDVGILRQRFPIFPLHDDGSTTMKEVTALKEFILDPKRHANMIRHVDKNGVGPDVDKMVAIRLRPSGNTKHTHDVMLTPEEVADLMGARVIRKQSEEENGHSHFLDLAYNSQLKKFYYTKCDNKPMCFDNHAKILDEVTNDS